MDVKKMIQKMTLEEKAGLCSGKDFWHFKGVERLGIPAIMVCDGPHGLRKQEGEADMMGINESIPAVCFPTASALAASFDRELIRRVGETIGEECRAEGVSVILGPGVNMKRTPLCGRNFEYFTEDPYHASEAAAAFINGVQSMHVGTSMKHFLANNQEYERMSSDSVVDERTLHEIYLAAFEGAVKNAQPLTVMCSYNKINGTYAAENHEMLTGELRDKWGFKGCVITDWGAGKDRVAGLEAGLDIEMPGGNPMPDEKIVETVKSGRLREEILDTAVERILRVIDFCTDTPDGEYRFQHERDHALAGAVEKECAVLLKNEDAVLPLSEEKNVAFIGAFASRPRFQGSGSSHIHCKYTTSALETAEKNDHITYAQGYNEDGTEDQALFEEAVRQAENADAAVVFAGLPATMESEGIDRTHMAMPEIQNRLISEVAKVQPDTVVVLHNGSPVEMPWVSEVKGILEMYLGGENVGEAAYDLLFGKANPCGKLAETFPLKLSDNPSYLNYPGYDHTVEYKEGVYVGYRYYDKKEMEVLFPFGHGLSYTDFTYEEIRTDKDEMSEEEELTVTVTVKNTGTRSGKEVVQLYVSDPESTVDRPVRELKGYCKVELQPGESRAVEFKLGRRAFAYYNVLLHDWHVETGEFRLEAGSSSRDIRLSKSIQVNSTTEVPVTYTKYSTIKDLLKTAKGAETAAPMLAAMQGANGQTSDAMGEGADEMLKAMMESMPIGTLVNFGALTEEQLDQMIQSLNG